MAVSLANKRKFLDTAHPQPVPTMLVADLASFAPADYVGCIVFVSDAATVPVLGYSDGTNWLRSDTGATVS